MPTSNQVYSNFYSRNDIVKSTAISMGKSLLIDALREIFREDNLYTYREDQWGFPLIPDHTNLPIEEAGLGIDVDGNPISSSQLSTKILITSVYDLDVKFYPVITIKQTGGKNHPISFNQNAIQVHYRKEFIRDGYGNQIELRTPTHFVFGDAWDQSFEIKIVAESAFDRDQIADIILPAIMNIKRDELARAGLHIKDLSMSGENEEESVKHTNKWLFTYTITLNCYSEWRREIPIRSVIERINFYFDVKRTGLQPSGTIDVIDNVIPDSAVLIATIP